ncbi:hypothetical protein H9L39_10075 [Fusarium oxysporum f. sp. albedinis]|nr:hypothetical protein H9L39_10075 [Fusarium oxysporum f. sp. albedinis]
MAGILYFHTLIVHFRLRSGRFSQLACSHLNPCRRFYALSQNAEQDDTYDTKQLKVLVLSSASGPMKSEV